MGGDEKHRIIKRSNKKRYLQ